MANPAYLQALQPLVLPQSDIYSHDELIDSAFETPAQLIAGMLIAGLAASWSGDIGIGKTWLELAAARSIASGRPFLGHFATTQAPVMIFDQESHKAPLAERLKALNRAEPMPRGMDLHVVLPNAPLYVNEPAGYAEVDRWLRERQPAFVFFDSLTRFHNVNENDAGQMADVNASFKLLMQDHGCGIAVLDHSRKPGLLDKGGAARHRLRGSNEKAAFMDSALVVERSDDDDGELTIRCSKARWIPEFPDFKVRLEVDGDRVALRYIGEARTDETAKPNAIVGAIIELQERHGVDASTVVSIAGYLDVSDRTVSKHLTTLREAGLVIERQREVLIKGKRGRKASVYDVVLRPAE